MGEGRGPGAALRRKKNGRRSLTEKHLRIVGFTGAHWRVVSKISQHPHLPVVVPSNVWFCRCSQSSSSRAKIFLGECGGKEREGKGLGTFGKE